MADWSNFVWCFVPSCERNSKNSPAKLFFNVPLGERRKIWAEAVGIAETISPTSHLRCCEDHFNVREDMTNYEWYEYTKSVGMTTKIKLKESVIPRYNLLREAKEDKEQASQQILGEFIENEEEQAVQQALEKDDNEEEQTVQQALEKDDNEEELDIVFIGADADVQTKEPTVISMEADTDELAKDFACQVKLCCFKSPSLTLSKIRNIECIPDTNKNKRPKLEEAESIVSQTSSGSTVIASEHSSSDQDFKVPHLLEQSAKYSKWVMKTNLRTYLGVPQESKGIIEVLEKFTKLNEDEIFLVFRKIRLNESNDKLSAIFNLTESVISRSLNANIPLIAAYLRRFVYWPDSDIIQANVPNSFRANFSKVESIIDCFEIQIEKPSNAVNQAHTWSEYKSCNTMKYLISCTPDGFINYVSTGFGGRSSDAQIVKHSGFLDKLRPNILVMADRGFKHIDRLLFDKNCRLVRPPSVSSDQVMSKEEVRQSKIIASLRVHVERVIKRIRDFKFLQPHACIHHSLLCNVDNAVLIACAIINMQQPIFS